MTATLPRDHVTGRFVARQPLPLCQKCGRVLFENLRAELICVWRCELRGEVVGHTGADVGVLDTLSGPVSVAGVQRVTQAPSDALTGRSEGARAVSVQDDTTTPTEETH